MNVRVELKNPSRESLLGITRIAEWWQTVIPKEGLFYPTLTQIMELFSFTILYCIFNFKISL